MTVYKVLKYPHVLLRKKSSVVEKFTPDLKTFADALISTMDAFDGIGLAAPQVGILKRVIVLDVASYLENESVKQWHGKAILRRAGQEESLRFPLTLVNPAIVMKEGEINFPFDGCLSLPGVSKGSTPRAKFIKMSAQDTDGTPIEIEAEGIISICLQHELDHLEGVLFIDHLRENLDTKEVLADIQEFEEDPISRKRMRKIKFTDARDGSYQFV